jgi:chemotaxis protein methyltransferase CheR
MPITAQEFDFVRKLVHRQAGISLDTGKEYLVETRLAPIAREEGFSSLAQLVSHLRGSASPALERRVIEAMTTNETTFLRDVRPFETLVGKVLPSLMAARATERRLAIWSAACSSGQEPYSIAMTLRERVPQLVGWDVRILATDLSQECLSRARAGVYSQIEVNRGLPAKYLVRFFRRRGANWQINDEIRRMVEFRQMNLMEPWPPLPAMDVIFLRNVLIYFDIDTKKTIFRRIRRTLRPDGCLFLGAVETTLNLDDHFDRFPGDRSGCYRMR